MTLTPSVFAWPGLILDDGQGDRFGLTYAARGVARVWEGLTAMDRNDDEPLAALLGRTRAAILELTAVPLSTTQIARELGQSPGSVNQHLSVLRGTGLVVSRRSGRSVLYRQTPLAQSMTAARTRSTSEARGIARSASASATTAASPRIASRGEPGGSTSTQFRSSPTRASITLTSFAP